MGYFVISSFFYIFAKRFIMSEGIWLRKGKIYKVRTDSRFKRNYMLFSPLNDFYRSGTWHSTLNTAFTINMNGEFVYLGSVGIWSYDTLEPLTFNDWLEIGQYLKNTKFRVNLKTKEMIDTEKEEELVEI